MVRPTAGAEAGVVGGKAATVAASAADGHAAAGPDVGAACSEVDEKALRGMLIAAKEEAAASVGATRRWATIEGHSSLNMISVWGENYKI